MKSKPTTFSELYDHIVANDLTLDWIRKVVIPALLILIAIPLSYRMGIASNTSNLKPESLSDLSLALMVFFLVIAIFLGVIFGAVTNLVGVLHFPQTLTAKLLLATPHPFRKAFGLTYNEIQHLKEIGRTEQSASGWQGGFLSVAVVWFLVENLGLFSNQVIALAAIADKTKNIHEFSPSILGWSVLWGVICLLEALVALIVFNYLYRFLGYEPSNRAIIKACEDAQALLEALNIQQKKSFSIKDKTLIAENCQCSYIPLNQEINYKYRAKFKVTEQNGKEFSLLTKAKPKDTKEKSQDKTRGKKGK